MGAKSQADESSGPAESSLPAPKGRRHDRSRDVHSTFRTTLDHGAVAVGTLTTERPRLCRRHGPFWPHATAGRTSLGHAVRGSRIWPFRPISDLQATIARGHPPAPEAGVRNPSPKPPFGRPSPNIQVDSSKSPVPGGLALIIPCGCPPDQSRGGALIRMKSWPPLPRQARGSRRYARRWG